MASAGRRTRRSWPRLLLVAAVAAVVVTGQSGTIETASRTPLPALTPAATADPAPPTDIAVPGSPDTSGEAERPDPRDAATMSASAPVALRIPAIGVDSTVMDLGLQDDGTLEVPPGGFPAGWYTGSPTPGELGPAIVAGHVDWAGQPGVFFDLVDLEAGDAIAVTRQDGSTARFRVTRVERFAKDGFPTEAVYGDLDHAGLRLITCGGEFDRQAGSYRDNVVVFAELAGDGAG